MSRPTIIINDLDAERIDILLEQPAYAGLPIADALNAELDRGPNVFARRDATRRGDNEQPGLNSAILAMAKCVCARWCIRQK
ncbi:regulator of nucleoside diphosphate kinase [Escherichia coli]|uniref:Regulator of nucleoside diphosphate kinase n=1 Tax=Escherichia coli TaxID=562 RepID=A0A376TK73_ECOLX|nr:regulator of nucleoside diphosphate kinase [Escherichia coli]